VLGVFGVVCGFVCTFNKYYTFNFITGYF